MNSNDAFGGSQAGVPRGTIGLGDHVAHRRGTTMNRPAPRWVVLWTALLTVLVARGAAAQVTDLDADESGFEDESGLDSEGAPAAEAADADGEAEKAAEAEEPPSFLIGVRYRIAVVPQFLINAFGVDGGRTTVIHGAGPEVGFSQKNFEILLSPWLAGYSLERTPFKGPSDGEDAWELIYSNLKMLYLTGDFLWKVPLTAKLDFHIGVGAGVGIVFGDFWRFDAYWASAAGQYANPMPFNGDPYNTAPSPTNPALLECGGPNVPVAPIGVPVQCPVGGEFGPASAWPVYPWLTFQTGVRYSFTREIIGRLDLGAGSSGFWFGLGADYGL